MELHHVALTVVDLKTSADWYQEKLGFEVEHQYEKNGKSFCLLRNDKMRIELIHFGTETEPVPEERKSNATDLKVGGVKHFCLYVESADDFCEELRTKGVAIVQEVGTTGYGSKYFFFADPEGNLIEVISDE